MEQDQDFRDGAYSAIDEMEYTQNLLREKNRLMLEALKEIYSLIRFAQEMPAPLPSGFIGFAGRAANLIRQVQGCPYIPHLQSHCENTKEQQP